jgi:hypothetical protein
LANLLDQVDKFRSNDFFLFEDPFSGSIEEQFSIEDDLMLTSEGSKKVF